MPEPKHFYPDSALVFAEANKQPISGALYFL
jgi:hypothetical protein